MSLIDEANEEIENTCIKYNEFLLDLSYLKNEGKKYIFYTEGKDDTKYYFSEMKKHFGNKFDIFYLNNKKKVLEFKKIIDVKKGLGIKMGFIVDKDFSDLITTGNLYVTPTYAIENFYVKKNVVKEILKKQFGLNLIDPNDLSDLNKIFNLFKERKLEFLDSIDELIKWYHYQIKQDNEDIKLDKLNKLFTKIKHFSKKRLLNFDLAGVEKNYSLNDLKEQTKGYKEISEKDFSNYVTGINKIERAQLYRGKYLLEFLKVFLKGLKEDSLKESPVYFSERKSSDGIEDILSQFRDCAETPNCLSNFFDSFLDDKN